MRTRDASSRRDAVGSRAWLAVLSALVFVASAGACTATRGGADGESPNFRDDPVVLEIENQTWNAVHVYVLAGGQYKSLGQITSYNTQSFEVPQGLLGGRKEIRLAADPIGSREGFISDGILVEPGDVVSWTLTQPLIHSRVFVN